MHPNVKRGNSAQDAIASVLDDFGALVDPISPDRDAFSRDLMVQVEERNLVFFVQAKTLTKANLRLKQEHIRCWLAQSAPTIPMWWDRDSGLVYWASAWHHLLLTRGAKGRTTTFSRALELRCLERANAGSWLRLLEFADRLATLWHLSHGGPPNYPPPFIEVLTNPEILPYVAVPTRPVHLIRRLAPEMTPTAAQGTLMQVANQTSGSASRAFNILLDTIPSARRNEKVLAMLRQALAAWFESVPRGDRPAVHVWALDCLLQMLDRSAPSNLRMGPFRSAYAWPLCSLVKLLPPTFMISKLEGILTDGVDANARLYAAYLLGNLDYADADDHIMSLCNYLSKSQTVQVVGKVGSFVLPEAEWAAAKQGSAAARRSIVSGMEAGPTLETQVLLNWRFFGARSELALDGVRRHLEGLFRGDDFMKKPLQLLLKGTATGIERGILQN
jgi:hypothetical protein